MAGRIPAQSGTKKKQKTKKGEHFSIAGDEFLYRTQYSHRHIIFLYTEDSSMAAPPVQH